MIYLRSISFRKDGCQRLGKPLLWYNPPMILSVIKLLFRWALIITSLVILLTIPRKYFQLRFGPKIHQPDQAPAKDIAIVFGAGLRRDGFPTNVLADRVRMASALYNEGKVNKLFLSGSTRTPAYDEPAAMRELAIQLGVPQEDIIVDPHGFRTYDTCYRAKHVFNFKDAILVSQAFHLPRALGICEAIGLQADGVASDLSRYSPRAARFWSLREIPAAIVALWDVYVAKPRAEALSDTLPMSFVERYPHE